MSITQPDVQRDLTLTAMKWAAYAPRLTELQNIATFLGLDTTTHDATIETPPAGTRLDPSQTTFTNACLITVNTAKGGNLPNTQIAAAINNGIAAAIPPSNTAAPALTYVTGGGGAGTVGAQYVVSNGSWQPTPASYARQWLRNGAAIPGATTNSYTIVAADSGTQVACVVTATNPAGSASATSNAVAVT